jgi:hypothetical protein
MGAAGLYALRGTAVDDIGARCRVTCGTFSAWADQTGLVGLDDHVESVAQIELGEQLGEVGLDGLFR